MDKEKVEQNIKELLEARVKFFEYLDMQVPKVEGTDVFDFSSKPELKEAYAKFYGYDYAIRKLLLYLYKAYGVSFNV